MCQDRWCYCPTCGNLTPGREKGEKITRIKRRCRNRYLPECDGIKDVLIVRSHRKCLKRAWYGLRDRRKEGQIIHEIPSEVAARMERLRYLKRMRAARRRQTDNPFDDQHKGHCENDQIKVGESAAGVRPLNEQVNGRHVTELPTYKSRFHDHYCADREALNNPFEDGDDYHSINEEDYDQLQEDCDRRENSPEALNDSGIGMCDDFQETYPLDNVSEANTNHRNGYTRYETDVDDENSNAWASQKSAGFRAQPFVPGQNPFSKGWEVPAWISQMNEPRRAPQPPTSTRLPPAPSPRAATPIKDSSVYHDEIMAMLDEYGDRAEHRTTLFSKIRARRAVTMNVAAEEAQAEAAQRNGLGGYATRLKNNMGFDPR